MDACPEMTLRARDPYSIISRVYDIFTEPFMVSIRRMTVKMLRRGLSPSPGRRILEVACGTGTQAEYLAREGFEVAALDISPGMIRQAKRKRHTGGIHKFTMFHGDASCLPFDAGTFSGVLIQLALHEMRPETRHHCVEEMKRVSREGALLLFVDFLPVQGLNIARPFLWLAELAAGLEHFRRGREFIKAGGLPNFLETHQLKPTEVQTFFFKNVCLAVAHNSLLSR